MISSESRRIAVTVCFFAGVYSLYGLVRHWHFGSGAFDLGIFDQAVWHLSRGEPPASSISGFTNVLGDHFYPVIAAFVPLYWIAPAPELLIAAQAALFALSIIPVHVYLRGRLPAGASLALSIAYALFWGLQRAIQFDVHEFAFAPLLIATAICAQDRSRWGLFWGCCAAIALVKEDLLPLLAALGLYLAARGEMRRGVALSAAALTAFFVIVRFVIPGFSDSGAYIQAGTYDAVLRRPWLAPGMLVTPATKVWTASMWLAPFLMLPLCSPLSILLVPLALERFLSASPNHWGMTFHYSAPLAPILAMSAGDGLARVGRWVRSPSARSRVTLGLALASVVLSAILPGHLPLWRLVSPPFYAGTPFQLAAPRALALIPVDSSVVAQAPVVPHLSHRPHIYVLDEKAPDADYVVATPQLSPWPLTRVEGIVSLLDDRKRRGYGVVFDEDGWIVLRR